MNQGLKIVLLHLLLILVNANLRNHLALLVNITLNCQVVSFDIGCHEAITTF